MTPLSPSLATTEQPLRAPDNRQLLNRSFAALKEIHRRKLEGLKLYAMLPPAEKFHRSQAAERLAVGSNRSGKTQTAVAEFAMAVLGVHPYIAYPKGDGIFYAVGFDFGHIREVMWKKLAKPGAFKVIRDERTHDWRPVLPNQAYDAAYKEKWRNAGPMLPRRSIRHIAWNKKNEEIPEVVTLKNGTVINWYSSRGSPQQGSSIDGAWFDEEIENAGWLPEVEARLLERGGRFFWSFTPEHLTQQAFEMHQRASRGGLDAEGEKNFDVEEFFFSLEANPFISDKQKKAFFKKLRTQHERDTKYHGKYALTGLLVYPEYSREAHLIKRFEPPKTWSRYMVVDPGVQVCAVLFFAVPPPGSKQQWERHLFGELYLHRCSSARFAEEVERTMGFYKAGGFEAFLIDRRMGRQTQMSGQTVEELYTQALRDRGIWSQTTRSGFFPGNDNISAREDSLRGWLDMNVASGIPTLRVHDCCVNFEWEMSQQFYKKEVNGPPTDKRVDRNNHAVTCAEYFADFDPRYVVPKEPDPESQIYRHVKSLKAKKHGPGKVISLGPTGDKRRAS